MSEPGSNRPQEEILTENADRSATPLRRSTSTASRESLQQSNTQQDGVDATQTNPTPTIQDSNDIQNVSKDAMIEKAKALQASLLEIAESIELVKVDHDKLEKQNLALQDYIGGLTRAMSKGQAPKKAKGSGK